MPRPHALVEAIALPMSSTSLRHSAQALGPSVPLRRSLKRWVPMRRGLFRRIHLQKMHGLCRDVYHISAIVKDHDTAGSQGAAGANGGIVRVTSRSFSARKPPDRPAIVTA